MSKTAVIDIGSNSVRLVVFDALARAPHYVFNEKAMCRLGAGMKESGHLSPDGVEMAKHALSRFVYLSRQMGVGTLSIVGTAALREASDGPEFVSWVEEALGARVRVLAGTEEARYSAQGVMLGWPNADGLVCDIGGSSMELIVLQNGEIGEGISLPLGPLQFREMTKADAKAYIKTHIEDARAALPADYGTLYLVGGSWRALGKIDMARRGYPFPILHEYQMTAEDVRESRKFIKGKTLDELNALTGTSLARLELVELAGEVLKEAIKAFAPNRLAISAYGLREGVLFDSMPEDMRRSDPLLTATRDMESQLARFPGFAEALYDWLTPIRAEYSPELDRIAHAACNLHDTNWHFHPDYRAHMSFEVVNQANICGITHEERVFLAVALSARYENSPNVIAAHPAIALLSAEEIEMALELGRALRLGAMISAGVVDLLADTKLEVRADAIVLTINKARAELYGDSVEKRLNALGKLKSRDVAIEFSS